MLCKVHKLGHPRCTKNRLHHGLRCELLATAAVCMFAGGLMEVCGMHRYHERSGGGGGYFNIDLHELTRVSCDCCKMPNRCKYIIII